MWELIRLELDQFSIIFHESINSKDFLLISVELISNKYNSIPNLNKIYDNFRSKLNLMIDLNAEYFFRWQPFPQLENGFTNRLNQSMLEF